MKHLTPEELVDYLEDTLLAARAAHVTSCDRCRQNAETMRALVADASASDVPEPSPLFWDHFSARVREAVAAGPSPEPEGSRGNAAWGWVRRPQFVVEVCLAAAALALVVFVVPWRNASETPSSGGAAPAIAEQIDLISPAPADADADWALVVDMADGVDWDTAAAAGFGVRPGAAEHAVLQLSREEQSELLRLLRAELEQPSS
jgi:hypothetical protein